MRIEAASEPLSGSVIASAVIGGSSPASGASQRCFCSSVPEGQDRVGEEAARGEQVADPGAAARELLLHEARRQAVGDAARRRTPSGSMNEVSPSPAALRHSSQGTSTSASSTASEAGRISRAANSRQTSLDRALLVGQIDGRGHLTPLPDSALSASPVWASIP